MSISIKAWFLSGIWEQQPLYNLIDTAIQYSRAYREEFKTDISGIKEGLTPEARRSTQYLRVRESINKGCREAVKVLPESHKRSMAFSVLMGALYNMFHYGKTVQLMDYYNNLLDSMVGTH